MKARAILRTLIEEVKNPDISNGPAAVRAAMDAQKLFQEEEDALSKRSPAPEVPRAGESGQNEAVRAGRVGESDALHQAPGKKAAGRPRGKAA